MQNYHLLFVKKLWVGSKAFIQSLPQSSLVTREHFSTTNPIFLRQIQNTTKPILTALQMRACKLAKFSVSI